MARIDQQFTLLRVNRNRQTTSDLFVFREDSKPISRSASGSKLA